MSPVFFVPKRDGKKKKIQDYQYLNSQMIKNNYPLPLISNLIDNIGKKKIFMEIDLRQGYNNVKIKKENEQKAVFLIPKEAFELTLMFFGLTNSLATFQMMINNLLRDMIEARDIAAFIDNIMVGMEIEKVHDEIMKEV